MYTVDPVVADEHEDPALLSLFDNGSVVLSEDFLVIHCSINVN